MARETMKDLIRRLRRLVSDSPGESQTWDDDDLQDALDNHRREVRYGRLREIETISPNGTVTYLNFSADVGNWEETAVLTDSSFNVLSTSITPDLLTGRWTFTTQPNWPVLVTGWYYDLYGAAAEIVEAWISKEKCAIDVSIDGQTIRRSQRLDHLERMLKQFRAQMWADSMCLQQSDVTAH